MQNWNKDAKPLFSRRSFSSQFKPWPIPWPKLAAGSMDHASSTLTSSRDFPQYPSKSCQGDRLSPQGFPENYSPITDLLDDGCKRPFLEQKETVLSSYVALNQKGILPISVLPTFQCQGCGAFPPPPGYQVSPDLFPAAGHWHLATQQLPSQCPKVVALLQTPPDAFKTAYTPTPVKRKDSEQLSENYFNCYTASNTKLQNTT